MFSPQVIFYRFFLYLNIIQLLLWGKYDDLATEKNNIQRAENEVNIVLRG